MKRRALIVALAGALAVPRRVAAQPRKPARIGVIHTRGGVMNRDQWGGKLFVEAMKDLGHEEGRHYIFDDRRWAKADEVPALARDLVRLKADVIVAATPYSIVGAKSVTDSVPIVFVYAADPLEAGLVKSLSRPEGNLTGFAWDHGYASYVKSLELLREAIPSIRRVANLWDAADIAHPVYAKHTAAGAVRMRIDLLQFGLNEISDFEPAFARMRKEKCEGILLGPGARLTIPHRHKLLALTDSARLAAVAHATYVDWPGALLNWAPNHDEIPRQVARYVDRILKGAKPADLPVVQPSKYDLHVDLRVARKLGITIPQSMLLRADRVIE
jgi:putative tryptophan/tyrosine transport system substrate-binding protein